MSKFEGRGVCVWIPDQQAQDLLDWIAEYASFDFEAGQDLADTLREAGFEESEVCPDYIKTAIVIGEGEDEDE